MKDIILDFLRNSDDFVSGEDISRELNVSRAAVWKYIKQLRSEGYVIESFSKKGYRLVERPDILNYEEIKDLLSTNYIGRNLEYFETIGSTNDYIKKAAENFRGEGLVVIAEEQTSGKGRMGRRWVTKKGDALAMSILLRPDISPYTAPSITPVLAVSIVKALNNLTGYNLGIKWPNDIVLNSKKLCGILTEMNAEMDRVNYIVIGCGMNINQEAFDDEISGVATSLRQYGNKSFDRKEIAAEVLNEFEKAYELFKREGIAPFIEDLKKYSVLIGKRVKISGIGESFEAEAVDIDRDGSLLVKLEGGEIKKVLSGDVSVRGLYGYIPD